MPNYVGLQGVHYAIMFQSILHQEDWNFLVLTTLQGGVTQKPCALEAPCSGICHLSYGPRGFYFCWLCPIIINMQMWVEPENQFGCATISGIQRHQWLCPCTDAFGKDDHWILLVLKMWFPIIFASIEDCGWELDIHNMPYFLRSTWQIGLLWSWHLPRPIWSWLSLETGLLPF